MTQSTLRTKLRLATLDVHERLHRHDGLSRVAAGSISRDDYRRLLGRLLGFHRGFEAAVTAALRGDDARALAGRLALVDRSHAHLIEADLAALGADPGAIARLPDCPMPPPAASAAALLGALYVVEGSTMGGRQMARAMERVLGSQTSEGRRFFLGYGEDHGSMWRRFLGEVDGLSGRPEVETAAVDAAVSTFAAFEAWMEDWRSALPPEPALAEPSSTQA